MFKNTGGKEVESKKGSKMPVSDINHNYNGQVLAVALCLESWLLKELKKSENWYKNQEEGFKKIIEGYCSKNYCGENKNTLKKLMHNIRKKRNKIAHPKWGWKTGGKEKEELMKILSSPCAQKVINVINKSKKKEAIPYFASIKDFSEMRMWALEIERLLDIQGKTGMTKVKIDSSLLYDMGNAGDFIKHGALAVYVNWWAEQAKKAGRTNAKLRFADPFAGQPWGWVKPKILKRLEKISADSPLRCAWDGKGPNKDSHKYYGSSYVVRHAAQKASIETEILASDKDEGKRKNLQAADVELIEKHHPQKFAPKDGYTILDIAENFDLILLDPYGNFLPQAVSGKGWLNQIVRKANEKLCVMVFVLDKYCKNDPIRKGGGYQKHHEDYEKWKKKNEKNILFLRCPSIKNSPVKGEKYDMEVLLISKQFCQFPKEAEELWDNLSYFASDLSKVLGKGTKVTMRR